MEKDKMKSEVMSLFSTPVVKTSLGRGFTKLETDCFTNIPIYREENEGMTVHQSRDSYLFDTFAEELKDIKKFCEYHLKQYLEEIEGVNTNLAGLRITQSWLNKNKPGELHPMHHHPNSYLSAVLYINCLPSDYINFNNRMYNAFNNIDFPMNKSTAWNTVGYGLKVIEGDLIIFPSWVTHYVDMNKTKDKERISLAFNAFPIGKMGMEYGNYLKL